MLPCHLPISQPRSMNLTPLGSCYYFQRQVSNAFFTTCRIFCNLDFHFLPQHRLYCPPLPLSAHSQAEPNSAGNRYSIRLLLEHWQLKNVLSKQDRTYWSTGGCSLVSSQFSKACHHQQGKSDSTGNPQLFLHNPDFSG